MTCSARVLRGRGELAQQRRVLGRARAAGRVPLIGRVSTVAAPRLRRKRSGELDRIVRSSVSIRRSSGAGATSASAAYSATQRRPALGAGATSRRARFTWYTSPARMYFFTSSTACR